MDERTVYDLADLFKVFGDTLGMTQSAISHQLRTLKQSKLVKARRRGKMVYYSLDDDHVRSIIETGREHLEEER